MRIESFDAQQDLKTIVDHAAHLLPVQGPIGVFIHHNTLHAFQHLPFEQAVIEGSRWFRTEPYMREAQYRKEFERGRILTEDIDAVLNAEPNVPAFDSFDRRWIRRTMLVPGLRSLHASTIHWEIDEGDLLSSNSDRELFQYCVEISDRPEQVPELDRRGRLRDALLALIGDDIDELTHPFLIRACGAFLDQGVAYWPMPNRETGFYRSVRALWMRKGALLPQHLSELSKEFQWQANAEMTAEDTLRSCLQRLHVPLDEWETTITAELLALPGWAGLMSRLEHEPELAPHEALPCSLIDFLAVRMTLTLVAVTSVAGGLEFLPRIADYAALDSSASTDRHVRAAELFQVAKQLGITVAQMRSEPRKACLLQREVLAFTELERRRVWQLAYERRHERMILGPLGEHCRTSQLRGLDTRPEAQIFFCLDEREESIRRNLEEIAPSYETLSAAGFYGIAVDYKGIDDANAVPLCPVVVKPQHAIREQPVDEHLVLHKRRRALRGAWARMVRNGSVSSRTLVRGALSTGVLGVFSLFPLIAHVLSPRQYSRLTRTLNRWILPEPRTELTLMRADKHAHEVAEHLLLGFTLDEKTDRVASVLRPAGLERRFSRIVVVLGHGSTSLNNPHESAHDCGACGGRRGGPNGRLFAAMANHPGVRERLQTRGIVIPNDTWFVGGYHDTCSDEIEYYDVDAIPAALQGEFQKVRATLHRATELDAQERSRRFEAAARVDSPRKALWHVQERSEHLAEPRPEYGHCTNAVCLVGRRKVTRGLFFDRRAFLVSYDPTIDPEGENLSKLLAAAIPVCAGISLEYYFSFVDNEGYGCGTKLPHNITGLVGVMNGPSSDLRTGLPWQMVEIHEPVRILFNIEAKPEILIRVIHASALLTEFVENRWIRLSTLDPDSGEIRVYRDGAFELSEPWDHKIPEVPTSIDWYRGKLEHLQVARITGVEKVA
ncbi:MAG TPA: DUF2309 domain-containing protein [Bryobacteraceae bacterium]|nr:DUF2309 domain-containing protein [Bryobacteraceae bacterium]